MFIYIYGRKIIGFDVFIEQTAEHAAQIVSQVYRAEGLRAGDVSHPTL
jgi:hypothetical protein